MNLKDVAEIQMGYPFRSRVEHDPNGSVAVIQMKDIDDSNRLHENGAIRVVLPGGKTHHLLRTGDVLFRSRGRSNGAALVPHGVGRAILSAPLLLIRPHSVLPEYLCWYINAPATQALLATMSEGTSARMISAETLKTLNVPLPTVAEQRHIVHAAMLAEQERSLLMRITRLREQLTMHMLMTYAQGTAQ